MGMEVNTTGVSDALHQIIQVLTEGVAVENNSGQLVFVNRTLEQLLGYTDGELLGLQWITLFSEPVRKWVKSQQIGSAGQPASHYKAQLLCKDGTMVSVQASTHVLLDNGRRQGTLSTFTDLGEQNHLQTRLQHLERVVSMGQHIPSVVHEMSNALTIISLQAQLLDKRMQPEPQLGGTLKVIQEQAGRMREMVDALRTSADPHQLELESADINLLIQHTLELLEHQLQLDCIRVTTELDPRVPTTEVDASQLQRVFVNLINNSCQAIAAEHQSGTLTISTGFSPSDNGRSANIRIQFADTGPGIPADVMPRIFEPFFTTKAPEQGMGLGLSICEQILTRHQGRIWAENNSDGGASFVLELPVHQPAQHPQPASACHSSRSIETLVPLLPHSACFP